MHNHTPGPVLIVAPTGADAALIAAILSRTDIITEILPDVATLLQTMGPETGAVIVAEEAITPEGLEGLLARLHEQEPWSDLPILLLTQHHSDRDRQRESEEFQLLESINLLTLVERPIRKTLLMASMQSALRSRQRQRQVRTLIRQRDHAIENLQVVEESLRRQTALLQAVTHNAPDLIFAKDLHCRLVLANPATVAAIGKPLERVLGRSEFEWLPEQPEMAQQIVENDRRIMASGIAEELEEHFGSAGQERVFLSTKAPMFDAEGRIIGLVGVSRDITERKRAEQELAEAHRFFHSALDALTKHIAVLDEHGVILAVNEAWRRFATKHYPDNLGDGVGSDYLKDCDGTSGHCLPDAVAREGLAQVLAGERAEFHYEYPYHSPVEPRWFVMRASAFLTPGPRRVVVAHEDITERKRVEQALRESEARLQMAVTAGNIGTWVWNVPDNTFVADERLAQFFDLDVEEAKIGLPGDIFIAKMHPDDRDRVEQLIRAGIETGGEIVSEYRVIGRDGKIRWVFGQGRVELDAEGKAQLFPGALTDITAHKRSEEALRESETRFRTLADDAPLFIWMADREANVVYTNRTFLNYLGIQDSYEFTGRVWDRIVHAEDLPRVQEIYGRAVREEKACVFEVRLREAATGEFRWHLIRGVPRVLSDQFDGFMGVGVDIHDRKDAEVALRRGAERQRILSEALGFLLSSDDPEKIVHELFPKVAANLGADAYFNFMVNGANDLALHAHGGLPDEVARRLHHLKLGEGICGTVAQSKQPLIVSHLREGQGPAAQFERDLGIQCHACHPLMRGQHLLGTLSFASRHRTHFDEAEVEFLRVISSYVAVAMERAQSGRALRLSEAQLRAIYDGTHEYIGLLATDGRLIQANRASLEFASIRLEDVVGKSFWETPWFQSTEGAPELMRQGIQRAAQGHSFRQEVPLRRPSGELMVFDFLLHPIRNEVGEVVLIVPESRDITAQKHFEEELHQAKVQAEAANAAKDHFLATLSHELRTPLTPVLMCLSDRVRDPSLPEDLLADLTMICRNVQLEARLIDDLLDLTRIARGKLELHPEIVDVHHVLREAIEICSAQDGLRAPRAITLEAGAERHYVMADRARLQQVFWNLINNAIKFTPDDGRIMVRTTNGAEGWIGVEVQDTGIGMDPTKIARLFDAFEQGERAITRKFGGLGLGLAISKALISLHGGRIGAQSEGEGKGALFTVELETCEAPAEQPSRLVARDVTAARALRVLLVEDHAPTLAVVARLLGRAGHEVFTASRVADARGLYGEHQFDLLLSDLGLPDGSGTDLIREFGARTPASIALSGYGMDSDVRECLAAGFQAHLTKPVDWPHLEATILQLTGVRCS